MTVFPGPAPDQSPGDGDAGTLTDEQAVLDAASDIIEDVTEGELAPEDVAAMEHLDNPRRVVFVHAHPDDETIATGATMARYTASGASVTLVTCTRGELGEVIPDELAHLEGSEELADHRVQELATAMEALGVTDHRFLGDDATDAEGRPTPVRYRDSGMVWTDAGTAGPAPDVLPDAFALVDVDEAAAHLARVLRETRPQVVVTYEPGGGYGHPDHVQAHAVTMRAAELAADPDHGVDVPWQVTKVYWSVVPASVAAAEAAELAAHGLADATEPAVRPSVVVPDGEVTTEIEASAQRDAKAAALRAHATQVVVGDGAFALSNGRWHPLRTTEHYRIAVGNSHPGVDGGFEQDLFAGIV